MKIASRRRVVRMILILCVIFGADTGSAFGGSGRGPKRATAAFKQSVSAKATRSHSVKIKNPNALKILRANLAKTKPTLAQRVKARGEQIVKTIGGRTTGLRSRWAHQRAASITHGHAIKHLREYADIGIRTRTDLKRHVATVLRRPDITKRLARGRLAFLHVGTRTIVIIDRYRPDKGTVFRNRDVKKRFEGLN